MPDYNAPPAIPWAYDNRNFKNQEHPHHYYIRGGHTEDEDGASCVGVGVIFGNPTSGDIPRRTAALIVRAVNTHERLERALQATLKAWLYEANLGDGIMEEHAAVLAETRAVLEEVLSLRVHEKLGRPGAVEKLIDALQSDDIVS